MMRRGTHGTKPVLEGEDGMKAGDQEGSASEKANAIEKALQILMLYHPHNKELSTTEVSQRLGLHKATASRILLTLARHGFLQQNSQNKLFQLGPAVLRLSTAVKQSLKSELVQIAKPYLDGLRDLVNETVGMEVISGDLTVLAYLAEGARPVRTTTSLGATLPINAAAGAKAIFAYSESASWRRIFERGVTALTERTITDPQKYGEQLKLVRALGFSIDEEEIDLGVTALAAPVFNHESLPVAAVVIIGPSDRVRGEREPTLVAHLKETAARISRALHYEPEG
ncbi:MAG: IclR family transcriptional regulator [Deltaproteobacteria bacterium]|nr:IclR family transcriptional regulator [Deltaproteobacteria bacterium]